MTTRTKIDAVFEEETTYTHPQEEWDAAKCAKIAKQRGRDGYGTPHPWPGAIASHSSSHPMYGQTRRYNGGTIINGEFYNREAKPLPRIAPGYKFLNRPTWGTYLVKDSDGAK